MTTPTVPIPHCVKVELRHLADGQSVYNTFYAQCPVEPNFAECEDMANAAVTAWAANWQAHLPTTIELAEVVATTLTGLTSPRADVQVTPPLVGTNIGAALPLNVTLAIKRATGNRGKGRNGRIYWPCLMEGQVSQDRVDVTEVDVIATAVQAMGTAIANGGPAGTEDVVAHQHGSLAGTSTRVQSYLASDNYVDSQRDRLPRHKKHKRFPIG